MIATKTKVLAYIYRQTNLVHELLVFDHEGMPEAGTQIVGGTVENGEELKAALAREILEEAGLKVSVDQMEMLSKTTYKRSDKPEINERTYFKIALNNLPDKWSHRVNSDGEDNGLIFNFYWLSFDAAKVILTGNFAECLHLI